MAEVVEDDAIVDSSEDDSSDDDDAMRAKLAELEARLEASTEDYDAHLEKVRLLRGGLGELEELRLARSAFAKAFPLTPKLWLEWIEDESRLASSVATPDDKEAARKQVGLLFQAAIEDYFSVDLWLEYCHFGLGELYCGGGAAKAKSIFEKAIEEMGTHVGKGGLIWETYRDLVVATGPQGEGSKDPSADPVDSLFRQQLALPLLGMEATMEGYKEWLSRRSSEPDALVVVKYQRALARLKEYKPFEDRLATLKAAEDSGCGDQVADLSTVYSDYLAVVFRHHEEDCCQEGAGEEALVSSRIIRAIYERRLTDLCLNPMSWLKYLDYLEETGGSKSDDLTFNKVCARAVRNVPEWPDLWIRRLLAMERLQRPDHEVREVFEAALSRQCFFQFPEKATEVWLTYIAYRRRSLFGAPASAATVAAAQEATEEAMRNLCAKAVEHTASLSGADPEFRLPRLWATMEASLFKDLEAARRLWSEVILPGGGSSNPSLWLENVAFEKVHGGKSGPKHIRRVFARSLEQCLEDRNRSQKAPVAVLSEAWLQYERENGTYQQFSDCRIKVSKAVAENSKAVRSEKASGMKAKAEKGMKLKSKPDKMVKDGMEEPPKKKPKVEEDPFKKPAVTSKALSERPKVMPPPGYEKVASKSSVKQGAADHTVFVSNLDFGVDEAQLEAFIKAKGPVKVKAVRLVKNYSGKSKGYGYVEFETLDDTKATLTRDREPLDGRPVFISVCDPKNPGKEFKFSTSMEKNKLFVRNLPVKTTKEELEVVFGKFGDLKDVRLVTYRNGHSKGLAYIEFKDPAAAARALVSTDKTKMGDREIQVEISNPPPTALKKAESKELTPRPVLGGLRMKGKGEGRPQVMQMVPRSVLVLASNGTPSSIQGNQSSHSENQPKKSNQDFRAMLLGKR